MFIEKLWRMDGATKMREVIREGAYGILPPGDSYDDSLPITFLRATEMMPNLSVDLASCHRVARDYFKPKARLSAGDVLLAVKGATIASNKCVAIIEEDPGEAVVNGSVFRMQFKNTVRSKYAAIVLDLPLMKRQMQLGLVANNGVDYLDKTLIHSLVFPVPSPRVQREVVSIYEKAVTTYKTARADAEKMLSGIDDYLLAELGIDLPPEPENTIANRIFTAQHRDLSGWRFDPDMAVYSRHTRTSRFPLSKLKVHLLAPPQYGANERGVARLSKDVPRYVRITDVNEYGELSGGLGVAAELAEDRYLLTPGDLLFARSGNTVGKTYLHLGSGDEQHLFAGYMIRFRLNTATLLPEYAFAYTLCSAYKEWCSAVQRAAGQPNINAEEYKSLLIPVPPIDKQAEIAARVFEIREQAKQFRQQAEEELETAKRRIEAMLLGEDA